MMKYRALILDIDGTLVDSRAGVFAAMDAVKRRFCGRPATAYELELSMTLANKESFYDFPDDMFEELTAALESAYRDKPSALFCGAEEFIRRTYASGAALCVLTSRERSEMTTERCMKPLLPFFSHIVCADCGLPVKPSPVPAQKLLELCGVPPNEALFIGDSQSDSLSAAGAGIPFALACWGALDQSVPADFKPRGFDELNGIIFDD